MKVSMPCFFLMQMMFCFYIYTRFSLVILMVPALGHMTGETYMVIKTAFKQRTVSFNQIKKCPQKESITGKVQTSDQCETLKLEIECFYRQLLVLLLLPLHYSFFTQLLCDGRKKNLIITFLVHIIFCVAIANKGNTDCCLITYGKLHRGKEKLQSFPSTLKF